MKELIEKIKEIEFYSNEDECRDGLARARQIICEQEEKPFNPLELGFELSIRCLDHLVWTNLNCLEFILLKGNYKYYLKLLKKESQIWIFREDITYDDASKTILEPIFIPSHRFGVELLQNLGVIE